MNQEKKSAMNASPKEYIGGALVLAGFLSARGAIRGLYEDGIEQSREIKQTFKEGDSKKDKAVIVIKDWRYKRSLVAVAMGARDELRKGAEIFRPTPKDTVAQAA